MNWQVGVMREGWATRMPRGAGAVLIQRVNHLAGMDRPGMVGQGIAAAGSGKEAV